jgi:hypothetical protein
VRRSHRDASEMPLTLPQNLTLRLALPTRCAPETPGQDCSKREFLRGKHKPKVFHDLRKDEFPRYKTQTEVDSGRFGSVAPACQVLSIVSRILIGQASFFKHRATDRRGTIRCQVTQQLDVFYGASH